MNRKDNDIIRLTLPHAAFWEYQKLKNNVLASVLTNEACSSLCITSSVKNEGVSFLALALAQLAAEEDSLSTLYIDTNLREESVASGTKLQGLSDIYLNSIQLEAVIYPTSTDKLFILPAGRQPSDPAVLLRSTFFRNIYHKLCQQFSLIIFNTPSLQLFPEASVIAQLADAVLLVVKSEDTRREVVQDTINKLKMVDAHLLGSVLNQTKHYIPKLLYKFI